MDALEIMFGKRSIADKIAESKEGYKEEITEGAREKYVADSLVKRSDKKAIVPYKTGIDKTTIKKTTTNKTDRENAIVKKTTVNRTDRDKDKADKGKDAVMASGVSTMQIKSVEKIKDKLSKRYIAFDTETTGFSAYNDRIIELGAVLFEDGKAVKSFGSLVNAGKRVPASATRVNNITNDMLAGSPKEDVVYPEFVEFLGDAITGDTIICAHNASFDMRFLSATFERLGIDANIKFVDTLALCKKYVTGICDHKQPTMAQHFNISQQDAHRAESDALVCGGIMAELLKLM
ncbi:PolC-type DNA polymerase III [Butyrivibrio fibrisolvens]|uniref:3'-5' exonuclease n=1 Tax=Butyrivibrio fibrisolvens TaxID=831 RepID=UPI0020BD95B5|nr:3'-5' exonuclease [Butyrivibrio fibrisolvens]